MLHSCTDNVFEGKIVRWLSIGSKFIKGECSLPYLFILPHTQNKPLSQILFHWGLEEKLRQIAVKSEAINLRLRMSDYDLIRCGMSDDVCNS